MSGRLSIAGLYVEMKTEKPVRKRTVDYLKDRLNLAIALFAGYQWHCCYGLTEARDRILNI